MVTPCVAREGEQSKGSDGTCGEEHCSENGGKGINAGGKGGGATLLAPERDDGDGEGQIP